MKKTSALQFEDHFHVSQEDLLRILNIALSRGGDFSEIFLEHKIYNLINMEEDIIKETAESISLGLGIRVISGERTGYGYTNDFSFEKIKKAALTAASIANTTHKRDVASLTPARFNHNYYPVRKSLHNEPLEKKITLVKKSYHSAMTSDPKIKKVRVTLLDQTQHLRIVNSEGLDITDVRPLVKLVCLAVAEQKNKR